MALRREIEDRGIMPFVGVYDAFSASLVARHFEALFLSGFGFAASQYGLPDVGFATWSDIASYVQRLRMIAPDHYLLVDIDDGYGDDTIAAHVATSLEAAGASAVVLEDQKRPRKCGHLDGKELLDLDEYTYKLKRVLSARTELFVIARSDASEPKDILRRAERFQQTGADAVLVDGISDVGLLRELRETVSVPLAFNQIAGGKSPKMSLSQLREAGINIAIYSTPALFAAQEAILSEMQRLQEQDGVLRQPDEGAVGVAACNALLEANLAGLLKN
ncbi:MAG: isocitrate lyase/PEP mutase family protein [Acidimicrobiia bacterium]|nr:isocitrate lyase/PEP mutase family protein [Acidimicrobiia bacterium]NNL70987.1 isocitrate lyase/PEP mutase family protein [Acidimicrobiia bacterium]